MSEQEEKQESQKTLVAFVAGLLIGGLLVWVFGGSPEQTTNVEENPETDTTEQTTDNQQQIDSTTTDETASDISDEPIVMQTGEGSITVNNQSASASVVLESATFPNDEGWIGVRDYANGQLAGLLGVVRFSKEQGLIPETVILQRATQPGKTYAVVFYTENGDREFSLANDVQVEGVLSTFTAQ